MKKRILALLLAVTCVISCSACAGGEENRTDGGISKEADAAGGKNTPDAKAEETEQPNDEKYEYPSKDAEEEVWKSPLGYTMSYNPTVFTVDDTGEADVFTYNTSEKLDAPVYISVQSYPDKDAQTLAEGLVLQSGIDGVEVSDVFFGADSIETKNVYIEREVDGINQIQIFYAIPVGKGSLLMEMGTYAGVPQSADAQFEAALGTFSLTAALED